jgi:hypothetical protein
LQSGSCSCSGGVTLNSSVAGGAVVFVQLQRSRQRWGRRGGGVRSGSNGDSSAGAAVVT